MHVELERDAVLDFRPPGSWHSRRDYSVAQRAPCRTECMQACRLHDKGKSLARFAAQHEIEIAGELIDRHWGREKGATCLRSGIVAQHQGPISDLSPAIEGDRGCGRETGEEGWFSG